MYNLSASATRDDLSLIAVIMKAPSTKVRFSEAQKLLDYGFSKFTFKSFGNKGDVIKTIDVTKGVTSHVDVVLDNSGALIEKGKDTQVSQTISLPDSFPAKISSGQKLGEATFTLDGKVLATVNLIAKNDVDKLNLFTMSKHVIYSWVDLLRS